MTRRSCLFPREPRWMVRHRLRDRNLPAKMLSWLDEPGSLTRRLRSACGKDFGVVLLEQRWARPFRSEARLLRLRFGARALVREVRLQRGDEALVLGRTIIPSSTLRGAQRSLAKLGTRPLGEVIFSYPKLARLRLEWTRVARGEWNAEMVRELGLEEDVCGRRTVYSIGGRNLLVCEFFLPGVLSIREPAHAD